VTTQGKSVSSKNATRHGIFATTPVIPLVERSEDWQAHRLAIVDNIAPVGALEEALAERVALQLWRLGRVVRFETETITNKLEQREPFFGYTPDADASAYVAKEWLAWTKNFATLPPTAKLSFDEAATVLFYVGLPVPEAVDMDWTVERVSQAIAVQAKANQTKPETMLARAIEKAESRYAKELAKADDQAERLRAHRSKSLVPEMQAELVMRYEGHLERSLHKTLHELERMQALRAGQSVSAPMVIDVTTDDDREG
jgi:hypothetical protein